LIAFKFFRREHHGTSFGNIKFFFQPLLKEIGEMNCLFF